MQEQESTQGDGRSRQNNSLRIDRGVGYLEAVKAPSGCVQFIAYHTASPMSCFTIDADDARRMASCLDYIWGASEFKAEASQGLVLVSSRCCIDGRRCDGWLVVVVSFGGTPGVFELNAEEAVALAGVLRG